MHFLFEPKLLFVVGALAIVAKLLQLVCRVWPVVCSDRLCYLQRWGLLFAEAFGLLLDECGIVEVVNLHGAAYVG